MIILNSRPIPIEDLPKMLAEAMKNVASGELVAKAMTDTAKEHVKNRYPNSKHWSPDKIHPVVGSRTEGGVNIDIAGAGRAYHDVTILPVHGQHLTIPIHSSAVGKTVADFKGLFRPWRSGGGERANILVQKSMGGSLVALFALAKSAFQRQDSTLLPTDEQFAERIESAWTDEYIHQLQKLT